jgi:signal transduction histidine kinase
VSWIVVYILFSEFRRQEFRDRLEEKALTTAKLLLEVREVDEKTLKLIDQHTINNLYHEKIFVFNDKFELIYESKDGTNIKWNIQELIELKEKKKFFKIEDQKDILGIFYDFEQADYYLLIGAEDFYGNKKLSYLFYSLLFTYIFATILVWLFTYQQVSSQLLPLKKFEEQISAISANQLNTRVLENSPNQEIRQITHAFNLLLERVDRSFALQQEFTTNASHELRTPISRLLVLVENLSNNSNLDESSLEYLKNIAKEVAQMSQIIGSLMILARDSQNPALFSPTRIDEVIFSAFQKVKSHSPQVQFVYHISEKLESEEKLLINANPGVLEIAFLNLFKNAIQYSNEKKIYVELDFDDQAAKLNIMNRGEAMSPQESQKIFAPFVRGSNSFGNYGSGLGLHITKRILDFHGFKIEYNFQQPDEHIFSVVFSR